MKTPTAPKKLVLTKKTIMKLNDNMTAKMIGGDSERCVSNPNAGCNTVSDDKNCTTATGTISGRLPFTFAPR